MQKGKKRNPFIFILVLLVFLAGIYLVGFLYAGSFFLPRTTINNVNVSFLSAEAANDALMGEGPTITVLQRSKEGKEPVKETINILKSGGEELYYDTQTLIKSQDRVRWFLCFFNENNIKDLEAKGKFNTDLLEESINQLYSMKAENTIQPKDAKLKTNAGRITIEPEVEGTKLDKEKAIALIKAAAEKSINGEGDQEVNLEEVYIEPEIRANNSNILKAKDELGKIISKSISIYISGESGKTITGAEIMDLISIDGYKYSPDEKKIAAFSKALADDYKVSRYEYVLEDDLSNSIKDVLLKEGNQAVQGNWYINYPTPGSRGNGSPSFIEVSIGKQHMWYYEYGEEILSCDVVTGDPNAKEKNFATPTGYFEIVYKLRDTHLIGEDYDVEVKYWMGFEYSGYYGFHDAPWRGEFGGKIFTYAPSHGCVNLPEGVAEALYERVAVETTEVYIYDRPEDYPPEEEEEEEKEKEDKEDKDQEEAEEQDKNKDQEKEDEVNQEEDKTDDESSEEKTVEEDEDSNNEGE